MVEFWRDFDSRDVQSRGFQEHVPAWRELLLAPGHGLVPARPRVAPPDHLDVRPAPAYPPDSPIQVLPRCRQRQRRQCWCRRSPDAIVHTAGAHRKGYTTAPDTRHPAPGIRHLAPGIRHLAPGTRCAGNDRTLCSTRSGPRWSSKRRAGRRKGEAREASEYTVPSLELPAELMQPSDNSLIIRPPGTPSHPSARYPGTGCPRASRAWRGLGEMPGKRSPGRPAAQDS